jgi:hypothetical protein
MADVVSQTMALCSTEQYIYVQCWCETQCESMAVPAVC